MCERQTETGPSARWVKRGLQPASVATAAVSLMACGGGGGGTVTAEPPPVAKALSCHESLKTAFKPDDKKTVLFVKSFKKDDPLSLAAAPPANAAKAAADVCLVKLLVEPGNPGPADAPSTTAGNGLEGWSPALDKCDGRLRAEAPGAFMGDVNITSTTGIGIGIGMASLGTFAATNGAVTVVTDGGNKSGGFGTYLLQPDGTPNTLGWKQKQSDFERVLNPKAR